MNYDQEKFDYLSQYYTAAQIDYYCKGQNSVLESLWLQCQPQTVAISDVVKDFDDKSIWLVDSPDGYVPIIDTMTKHKIQMFEITTKLGKKLVCSYDHYIETTNAGWKYAQNIIVGDKILTDQGEETVTQCQIQEGTTTYDLEVAHENRRYYTNGVSSHNSGKSLVLQNLAVNFVKQGLNTVYISLELSEELCAMRIDSMLSKVPTKDIYSKLDEVEIKVSQIGKKSGSLHIKQLAQGTTTNDLRAYLKNYELESGHKCDVLIVDYLDLLFPNNKRIDLSNLNIVGKFVTEELRGLGVELNMNIQTASQLNRSSVQESEHDHSHIAGGISKIQTADNVMSIYSTPAMKERGQYQIQFLKTRSSSGVGSKVIMGYDIETLRIYDLEESESEVPVKTAADMMADLRRKNTSSTSAATPPSPPAQPETNLAPANNLAKLKELTSLIRR